MLGVLSTTPNIEAKVIGDHSLNKRSMKKLIDILSKFGTIFLPKGKNNFPLKMISSKFPIGINYKGNKCTTKISNYFGWLEQFWKYFCRRKK